MFQFYLTKILNQTFLHDSHWGFFTFWVTLAQGAPPDAGKRHQGFATSLLTHPRQPDIARLLPMFKGKLTFSFFADIKVVFVLLEAFCQLSSIVLEPKVCIKYSKHWKKLYGFSTVWADQVVFGITEKIIGLIMSNFFWRFYHVFRVKICFLILLKSVVSSALKSCEISLI